MEKTIICESCGAEFSDVLPKCPYCGTMNYKGAEAAYMEKLNSVREDLADLEEVPQKTAKAALKKHANLLKAVLITAGAVIALAVVVGGIQRYMDTRRIKEEMYWRLENYPIMSNLYDRGEYQKAYEYYRDNYEKGGDMYTWIHADFCEYYGYLLEMKQLLEEEAATGMLTEYEYEELLYNQAMFVGLLYNQMLNEDEKEVLNSLAEEEIKDFHARWDMDEETLEEVMQKVESREGGMDYEFCCDYVEQWMEE